MCGYYHPDEGDNRVITRLDQVYNFGTMRALPMQYVTQDEMSQKLPEIVIDNPNHVKEFLFNLRLTAYKANELAQILHTHLGLS